MKKFCRIYRNKTSAWVAICSKITIPRKCCQNYLLKLVVIILSISLMATLFNWSELYEENSGMFVFLDGKHRHVRSTVMINYILI